MSKLSVTITRRKHGETCCKTLTQGGIRAVTEKVNRQGQFANEEFELEERKKDFHDIFINKKQFHAKQEVRLQVSEVEAHSRNAS